MLKYAHPSFNIWQLPVPQVAEELGTPMLPGEPSKVLLVPGWAAQEFSWTDTTIRAHGELGSGAMVAGFAMRGRTERLVGVIYMFLKKTCINLMYRYIICLGHLGRSMDGRRLWS